MQTPRTMVIGIDGATFDLVLPWARSGFLPSLARLMAEGTRCPLRAFPNTNSAAAWSSLVTGCNPGKHGVFDFGGAHPRPGRGWRPTTGSDRRRDPVWRRLSDAGRRVGVANVPISYPADAINGFMLSGMDTPSTRSPGFAHPRELASVLGEAGSDYVIDLPDLGALSRRDPERAVRQAGKMVESRARVFLQLMETRSWEFFMGVFIATDRMQHHFWCDEEPTREPAGWGPVLGVYRQIDAFLARALDLAGPDATVFVVSDHGFGPRREGKYTLNAIFERFGLLAFEPSRGFHRWRPAVGLLPLGRRLIPTSLQRPLAAAFPRLRLRAVAAAKFAGVDRQRSQVVASPHGNKIYVNRRGGETTGAVAPADYEPVLERVRRILLDLTDPDSGRRLVREVRRGEDVYSGPYAERGADLLVEWDDGAVGKAVRAREGQKSFVVGADSSPEVARHWKGVHRSDGIFIAHGPSVRRGAAIEGATQYDVAPTVLYTQGLAVPRDMDGRVLEEVFLSEYLDARPVVRSDAAAPGGQSGKTLSGDEAALIEERLRGLGYLE